MNDIETSVPLEIILKILGWSRSKFFSKNADGKKRCDELLDAGAIYMHRSGFRKRWQYRAFPSRLHKWISIKASKREII